MDNLLISVHLSECSLCFKSHQQLRSYGDGGHILDSIVIMSADL